MSQATLVEIKEKLGVDTSADMAKCNVTPQQAAWILRRCNRVNRAMRKKHVEQLRHDMESGHWYSDIDYIGFDKNGNLLNGQHRLKAVATSNLEFVTLKFDFDAEQHISMDTGEARKWAHQVAIAKKVGVVICSDQWHKIIISMMKIAGVEVMPTNTDLQEIFEKYSDKFETLDQAGVFNLGKIAATSVKAALTMCYLDGVGIEVIKHFAEVLRDGITRSDNDIPIIRLRDELIGMKGSSKALEDRRAALTQQTLENVLAGSTSNRLPSSPHLSHVIKFA